MRFNDESETFGEEPGGFSKPVFPTLILEGATSKASKNSHFRHFELITVNFGVVQITRVFACLIKK